MMMTIDDFRAWEAISYHRTLARVGAFVASLALMAGSGVAVAAAASAPPTTVAHVKWPTVHVVANIKPSVPVGTIGRIGPVTP